jgi:hypothetical protein
VPEGDSRLDGLKLRTLVGNPGLDGHFNGTENRWRSGPGTSPRH